MNSELRNDEDKGDEPLFSEELLKEDFELGKELEDLPI